MGTANQQRESTSKGSLSRLMAREMEGIVVFGTSIGKGFQIYIFEWVFFLEEKESRYLSQEDGKKKIRKSFSKAAIGC